MPDFEFNNDNKNSTLDSMCSNTLDSNTTSQFQFSIPHANRGACRRSVVFACNVAASREPDLSYNCSKFLVRHALRPAVRADADLRAARQNPPHHDESQTKELTGVAASCEYM